jgi:hypothetical protein
MLASVHQEALRIQQSAGHAAGLPASRRCRSTVAARQGNLAAFSQRYFTPTSWTCPAWTTSDTETLMFYRSALFAATAAVTLAGAAHAETAYAETLKPVHAHKVDLGSVAGVAYYTEEEDGHRLVVSLQSPDTGKPVRFVTTLAPGQRVTLSVPRSAGEPAVDVHFVRHGERIDVSSAGTAHRYGALND